MGATDYDEARARALMCLSECMIVLKRVIGLEILKMSKGELFFDYDFLGIIDGKYVFEMMACCDTYQGQYRVEGLFMEEQVLKVVCDRIGLSEQCVGVYSDQDIIDKVDGLLKQV